MPQFRTPAMGRVVLTWCRVALPARGTVYGGSKAVNRWGA